MTLPVFAVDAGRVFSCLTAERLMKMPITNDFTCPTGHKFSAVAKLRARCPDCGLMARREFTPSGTQTTSSGVHQHSRSSPNTSHKVVKRTTSESGSKPATTSKMEEQSESAKSESPASTPSVPKTPATVIRRGRPTEHRMATKRPIAKKPAPIVSRKKARTSPPSVRRLPSGSKERKVVEALEGGRKTFWEEVKAKYFR